MKKIVSLLCATLALLLLAGCSSGTPDWAPLELARRDAATDTAILGNTLAVAFTTDAPLGGLEVTFALLGEDAEITVSVYEAVKDYNTTLSAKPKRQKTFDRLSEKLMWQFRTLPAGDYIVVFSEAKNGAPLKSVVPSDMANGKVLHYRDGEIMTDGTCALTLLCRKDQQNQTPTLQTFAYPVPEE